MRDLIVKLEAATQGSRELDAEVCLTQRNQYERAPRRLAKGIGRVISYYNGGNHGTFRAERYTTSIDAVKREVNPAWEWSVSKSSDGRHTAVIIVNNEAYTAMAATPELAFCAAWLKARAS